MTGVTLDPGAVSDLLIRTGAKGVLLLGAVGTLTLLLRRGPAAGRHLVWFVGLVALMALPFLEVAVPVWPLPLPWEHEVAEGVTGARAGAEARVVTAPRALVSPDGERGAAVPGDPSMLAGPATGTPPEVEETEGRGEIARLAREALRPVSGGEAAPGGRDWRWRARVGIGLPVALVWAAGALLLLV
ncbi:MAG TPA: hypothetical protein VE173_06665, partial [Longimicrobiales bacterium]|nr:hypothetical protein [Longimicrobiales bacterium]